jgi:hypothetical protein
MSRTGIHGGIRRGSAAAAIGAVLVLATGVSASQAAEVTPDPGDPAAPITQQNKILPLEASLQGQAEAARQNAPGQNRDGKDAKGKESGGNGNGTGKGKQADPGKAPSPSPSASASAIAVPPALLPAVTATLSPSATAAPTPSAKPSTAPTPSAPGASRTPATPSATSAPAPSRTAPATSAAAPAPASAPAPEAAVSDTPETAAAPAGEPAATPEAPASEPGKLAAAGDGQAAGQAGTDAPAAPFAGTAATDRQAAASPLYSSPYAAPQAAGWTPYSTGTPGSAPRSNARLAAQPEPRSAMVWLGSGLVGVAGAAGLVLFRLRNP